MGSVTGLNSERVGRDNLSAVLREVHRRGAASRTELADRTGLYRQTIGSLVGQLQARGLVTEQAPGAGPGPGRPSLLVRARTDALRVVAVDIEVDSVAVAVVGLGGEVLRHRRAATHRGATEPSHAVERVVALAHAVLRREDRSRLVGAGVAVVGLVRREDGLVRVAPNLGWTDVPLAALLDDALGLGVPVAVGNEADLGALAEHLRGAAADADDVLYVSGEVGIGGGVIVAGRPLDGHRGYAGEIGHMVVNPAGARCGCGSTGCWETEVGEAALLGRAGAAAHGDRADAVAGVIRRAGEGDPVAAAAIREVGRWTGIGIGSLVNVLNPRVVVLGGLLARLHPLIADVVAAELGSRATVALREGLQVVPARFGADAPLLGAAELAFEPVLANPGALPELRPTARTA